MGREGSMLIITLILTLVIAGMAGAYLAVTNSSSSAARTSSEHMERLYIAESGAAAALAEIRSSQDYGGDGVGNVSEAFTNGNTYTVTTATDSLEQKTVTAIGQDATANRRAIEVVVKTVTLPLDAESKAAVTSLAPVSTTGTIVVDGRDHDSDGNLVAAGVHGVLCGGAVSPGGNSTIGGNGNAPLKNAVEADGVFDENYDFSAIYPGGYPDTPDKVFEIAEGSLKAAAQAAGTYFDNQADYDAFIATNGGVMPGGEVIYLDFAECTPTEIGSALNDPPSVLVMHNAAGTANMKNVHGQFRGLIIADSITHVNAGSMIIGAVQTIYEMAVGNVFGNGNSDIVFSSEVLANLPGVAQAGAGWDVVSWREIPPPD